MGEDDAGKEVAAFFSPLQEGVIRVLTVRHGMGHHNTWGTLGSVLHEDAKVNYCGKAQADVVGDFLRTSGITCALDLVVVSPFARALQTACLLLTTAIGAAPDPERALRAKHYDYRVEPVPSKPQLLKTIVQPLCAEQTMVISHLGRGNRGLYADEVPDDVAAMRYRIGCCLLSSCRYRGRVETCRVVGSIADKLLEHSEFCMFDFGELSRYCDTCGVMSKHPRSRGKWWHHGPDSSESEDSFRRRCVNLRQWLGDLSSGGARRVLMVSHGGVMEEAFACPATPPNCGFVVCDVWPCGATLRVSACEWVKGQRPAAR